MKHMLLFNRSPFSPLTGHLWFLFALLYCYIVLYIANKFNLIKFIYFSVPLLLVANLILGELLPALQQTKNTLNYTRNFLFTGIPFFFLGSYAHKIKQKIHESNISTVFLFFIVFLGCFLSVVEEYFIAHSVLHLGSILIAVSLFVLSLRFPQKYANSLFEKIGERYSQFIYLYHIMIGALVWNVIYSLTFKNIELITYIMPVLICFVTTLAASLFYFIKKSFKKKMKNNLL